MSFIPSPQSFALREELDAALVHGKSYADWSPALKAEYHDRTCDSTGKQLRAQLAIHILIITLSMGWDLWAVPQMVDAAIGWRLVVLWPVAALGMFAVRNHQVKELKLIASMVLIGYSMLAIYLGSFGNEETMARYAMATAYVLGISCLALPFNPVELKRYALTFALATCLIGMWPNPLPPAQLMMHFLFLVMSSIPVVWIASIHWNSKARAFLLDTRDDINRIELEKNNELLRQLSEQDPLTGLPNRRMFERVVCERLAGLANDPTRTGNLAVMMIDLDHFKSFNDRHGHQAGDRCLTMAAENLQAIFPKEYGILARFGGEEFIGAIREREEGQALALAEEMRSAIANMLVPVRDSSKPLITTSIGLAMAPAQSTLDLDDLIEMADVALYSAKRAGRDRVEMIEAATEAERSCDAGDRRRLG